MGWFYEFKWHFVCNEKGSLLSSVITQGNVDDREPSTIGNLLKEVMGKLFVNKRYISERPFNRLSFDEIHLIKTVRSNIKKSIWLKMK